MELLTMAKNWIFSCQCSWCRWQRAGKSAVNEAVPSAVHPASLVISRFCCAGVTGGALEGAVSGGCWQAM
jgi:hypothetical protein